MNGRYASRPSGDHKGGFGDLPCPKCQDKGHVCVDLHEFSLCCAECGRILEWEDVAGYPEWEPIRELLGVA